MTEALERLQQLHDSAKRLAASHAAYGGLLYSGHMGRMSAFAEALEVVRSLAASPGAWTQTESDHRPREVSAATFDGVKAQLTPASFLPSGDEPGRIPSAPGAGTTPPAADGELDLYCEMAGPGLEFAHSRQKVEVTFPAADPPVSPLPDDKGWFDRQATSAAKDMESLPPWLKRDAASPLPPPTGWHELARLAREATNGWACYAKSDTERRDIMRLHDAINAIEAELPPPPRSPARDAI